MAKQKVIKIKKEGNLFTIFSISLKDYNKIKKKIKKIKKR